MRKKYFTEQERRDAERKHRRDSYIRHREERLTRLRLRYADDPKFAASAKDRTRNQRQNWTLGQKEKEAIRCLKKGHLKALRSFGLTEEDYNRMLASQGGCGICHCPPPGAGKFHFCIDHDHATGKVRGLLCQSCNLLLGFARDDAVMLRSASEYLKHPPGDAK